MKTVKKEIILHLESTSPDVRYLSDGATMRTMVFTTKHLSLPKNIASMTHFVDVEIPETMEEFIAVRGVHERDLVEWLNENYGKS